MFAHIIICRQETIKENKLECMQGSSGKVTLVTGAHKGIGFEVARQLGKAGCTVVIGSRDLSRGYEAAEKLKAENIDARAVELDSSQRETIEGAAAKIGSDLQRLDILVNNAGIVDRADAEKGGGKPCTHSTRVTLSTRDRDRLQNSDQLWVENV